MVLTLSFLMLSWIKTKRHNMRKLHFKLMREFNNSLLNESLTKDRRKIYTLEEDIQSYIKLRKKYPEVESSIWIQKNGYSGLYSRIRRVHKLSWHDFKVKCGFNDYDKDKKYTLEEDVKSYIEIRTKYEESKSSEWMQKNKYRSLYCRILRIHRLTWHDFKKLCGFDDCDMIKNFSLEKDKQLYIEIRIKHPEAASSGWMRKNGHIALYARVKRVHELRWHDFKVKCGFNDPMLGVSGYYDRDKKYTLEEDIKLYIELRGKHSEARYSVWLRKNEHGNLYYRVTRKYKLSWKEFKIKCGFND